MFRTLLERPRLEKLFISAIIDSLLLTLAFWGAIWVRIDTLTPFDDHRYWICIALVTMLSVLIYIRLGLYRAVIRYVSLRILWVVTLGVSLSTLSLIILGFFFGLPLPRTVPIIYFAFSIILICTPRLLFKIFSQSNFYSGATVIIYGAGSSGRQLQLALNQGGEYRPIAFIDDNQSLQGAVIQGIRVYSPQQIERLTKKHNVRKLLLAMPSVSRGRRQEVIRTLEKLPCEILSIPGMSDLVDGKAKIDELNEVSIEDLLGRDPVSPIKQLMDADIYHKRVMVTGAGGSIGSELCRQIIRCKPLIIVLFEINEFALYSIENDLKDISHREGLGVKIIPLLGSVQRFHRLKAVMNTFKVQTVYHAAAYKHVPLVEYNVVEGVRNNIFGTLHAAQAAISAAVETFVLISTDKAVRPTNTMGATKRMAELVLQALAAEQNATRFSMVRFGNVLGSSGSVVPLFRKQIRDGGPITLTHPDIIRYFMTIPEAAQLVIQAGAMGQGGDVFVLDMGEPVRIMDLAERMVRLSGLTVKSIDNQHGDIEIKITGLRPGEKLFEELLVGDASGKTEHPRIMTANEKMMSWNELSIIISTLDSACHDFNHQLIRKLLIDAPIAFKPTDDICDLVWQEKQHVIEE